MMLIVSGVGFLIVAYSIGYMDGSDEERRFFAYMSLFVFSMLLLVQAGDLLLLLAGWGLVGLCSYFLIGYDQHRPAAIAAAKKAFIMNAFGDATMALALFVLIQRVGTLEYGAVFERVGEAGGDWAMTLIALGLLGGAVAKSAQVPLHTWLPDAMEGPTPVSALIHAATMVVGRRVHARPPQPDLRGGGIRPGPRRGHRRGDAAHGRPDRTRPDRHQARHRLLDDVADRLHVPRRRDHGLRQRDVPPDDARLLQGAALPRRRHRHPRARRRAGHAAHGRAAEAASEDLRGHPDRRAGAGGDPAALGLLLEGRDHRRRRSRRGSTARSSGRSAWPAHSSRRSTRSG